MTSVSLCHDTSVHHNADGGIRNVGSVELSGSASVRDNTGDIGAGTVEFDSLTMSDGASVTGNASISHGGGLRHRSSVTLTGVACAPDAGSIVYGNAPDDCYGH